MGYIAIAFFFSSRRRHTRWNCDWSSDVCSSDLIWAAAADGTKVPIAVLHKKGLARDGKGPLLLYGYGSYGVDIPDRFNSNVFSLVDRGVTFAVAHIRGGGALGKK